MFSLPTQSWLRAQRALDEANHFSTITAKRESNGEVAHADSVRSDLQVQQRQRELNDAKVAADRARLDLGVMLFSDPGTPLHTYDVVRRISRSSFALRSGGGGNGQQS